MPDCQREIPVGLTSAFREVFKQTPHYLIHAPGRIILLGEYLEFCQGPCLGATIDKGVNLLVAASNHPQPGGKTFEEAVITVHAANLGETISFAVDHLENKCDLHGKPLPDWALLPAGIAWMLRKEGLVVRGMQALVDSDLPPQIGLGEMSAWLVGFVLACQAVGGWNVERNRLAKVCWQAREEYAGKPCSLADVQVILWGEEQKAVFLDPTVMHCKTYELPPEVVFVLADTGVQQGNLAEKCLDRQTACQETLEYLRKFLPHLASLRDIQPTEFAAYAEYLPLPARLRAEYVIKENSRINSVTNALRLGKWRAFTAAIFTSHSNLRDLLEVNSPEPERLVAIARELPGCLGARVTAEGQAGCTLNVVDKNYVDDFTSGLRKAYAHQTGRELATHLFTTACGATVVPLDSV